MLTSKRCPPGLRCTRLLIDGSQGDADFTTEKDFANHSIRSHGVTNIGRAVIITNECPTCQRLFHQRRDAAALCLQRALLTKCCPHREG